VRPIAGGDPRFADLAAHPLPPQTLPTIGDRLSAKNVSWAWYAGAWNAALADGTQAPDARRAIIYNGAPDSPNFQAHHQPFNYFVAFAPGTKARETHLKDGAEFFAAIENGTLPQVAFYKPEGRLNQHSGYADVLTGDRHLAAVVQKIRASAIWPKVAIIVTYDENGGYWDHVAPPKGDRWGPGVRVPAIIISPYAKRGYVDHTQYDTTSISKFITRRFGLEPLPGVRANAGDLTPAFAFDRR
jgi:acid phosphatase